MKNTIALADERRKNILRMLATTKVAYIDDIRRMFYEGRFDRCRYDIKVLLQAKLLRKVDKKTGAGRCAVILSKRGAEVVGISPYRAPDKRDLLLYLRRASVYFGLISGGIAPEAVWSKASACIHRNLDPKMVRALTWYVSLPQATAAFYVGSPRYLFAAIALVTATRFHVAVVKDPAGTAAPFLKPGSSSLPATRVFFLRPELTAHFAAFLRDPLSWVERAKASLEKCLGRPVEIASFQEHADLYLVKNLGYLLAHGSFLDVGPVAAALGMSRRVIVYLDSSSDARFWLRRAPDVLCLAGDVPALLARGSKKPVVVKPSALFGGGSS